MSSDVALPSSSHIDLRGIRIAYSDIGTGPLVIDAHGLSSSRANNRRMAAADYSSVAAAGRRLISYDARGHGESTGTLLAEDYTWSALATDLLALADHFSPDAPVSGIGSSMGTGTLLHAAIRRSDRFDRLVLTAPPTAWDTRAAQAGAYQTMADLIEKNGPAVLEQLFAQAPIPEIFAGVAGYPPRPDIAPELMPTVFRGAGLTDLPPLGSLTELSQSTLVLAWAGDPGHPVSTAEKLVETLPNARLHVSETHADMMTWGDRASAFLSE